VIQLRDELSHTLNSTAIACLTFHQQEQLLRGNVCLSFSSYQTELFLQIPLLLNTIFSDASEDLRQRILPHLTAW